MLLVAAFIFVIATSAHGQTHQLTIRDNGKLCSPWIPVDNGQISLSHTDNQECAGQVGIEQTQTQSGSQVRLCCQAVVTTSSSVFSPEYGKQLFQPSKQRIVGGNEASAHSWPWQIRLQANGGLCGGTLIDTRHVVTAAHCFEPPMDLSKHEVIVGLHDIRKPVYGEQRMNVQKIFLHEQYDAVTYRNDVAVIRLAKPVTISDKINVIRLPGPEAKNDSDIVWVTGWGTTSLQGQTSPVLKQTWLNTMATRCPQVYSAYDNAKQICAGYVYGGGDACSGDSGGPLMYEFNGQWYLNGVVSFGNGCADARYPGVYTRVSYYLPWIRSKVASP